MHCARSPTPTRTGTTFQKTLTQYMKSMIPPFSTCRIFFHGFVHYQSKSLVTSSLYLKFLTTSASPLPSFTNPNISDEDDDSMFNDSSCVFLQDRDLLRKTQKGSLRILDLIDDGSVELDHRLYNKLLNRCTELGKLEEGRMVHAHFSNSMFSHYLIIQNTVVNLYAKRGSLGEARKAFDEMPKRDMVTWTALISGYSQNEMPVEALVLFPEMIRVGLRPNQYTFSSLLKAAGCVPCERDGMQIHCFSVKYGFDSNVYVGSALVDMYARCGRMGDAETAFERLANKNEVSWNALIACHARKGDGENALRLFWRMLREDFKPTHFTYSSVFSACAGTGALEQGKWVHGHMMKSGLKLIAYIGNTLLDMYAKAGSIEDAKKVFDRIVHPSVVSWNSMLTACAQHGLGREAVERFEKMLSLGIEPNEVTFLCVLTACSHAGLLERGQHYFELMKKFKVEAGISHFVTMVDLLGRAGLFYRAERFIREMPIEPTAAIWGALLGACRMHKNMELGAYAAERVFELDPCDSGPHIILSNIYASAGRWSDAAKVRKMMRESGVKKEPACSWVEIENVVHMFVANDDAHPQRAQIFNMWEKIRRKIEEIGYVPDTSHVLSFVDQQERETKLQYHSEKLALAFALLNKPSGSPIRIKKNIRVCGDCHSAFKFVSIVVKREIILRDTNRFHHFYGGSCSCGDYW